MFSISHLDGGMEQPRSKAGFPALLDELLDATDEHGEVAVSHESEWTLTVFRGGRAVWENVESDVVMPRHLNGLTREQVLELMGLTADGDLPAIESFPWLPGYGDD